MAAVATKKKCKCRLQINGRSYEVTGLGRAKHAIIKFSSMCAFTSSFIKGKCTKSQKNKKKINTL